MSHLRNAFLLPLCFWCISADFTSATIVINEIFYHAPDDLDDLEYVELFNAGPDVIDVSGWKLSKGVKFTFPKGTTLASGEFAVVCKDVALFREFYDVTPVGEFNKSLSNSSDEIRLSDANGKKVESVEYADRSPWPSSADGYSASLERVCATGPSFVASNWAASSLSENYEKVPSGTPGRANSVMANSVPPTIESVTWTPAMPEPGEKVTVNLTPKTEINSATVYYQSVSPGNIGDEHTTEMRIADDGSYTADIPVGEDANRLLRFWIVAADANGGVGTIPGKNDLRPKFSVFVGRTMNAAQLPVLQFFHVGTSAYEAGERYREEQETVPRARSRNRGFFGFGGFANQRRPSLDERRRESAKQKLEAIDLSRIWTDATLADDVKPEAVVSLAAAFRRSQADLDKLKSDLLTTEDIRAYSTRLPEALDKISTRLRDETKGMLNAEQMGSLEDSFRGNSPAGEQRRRGPGDVATVLRRVFNPESSWYESAMQENLDASKIDSLQSMYREFITKRDAIDFIGDDGRPDIRNLFRTARSMNAELKQKVTQLIGEPTSVPRDRKSPGVQRETGQGGVAEARPMRRRPQPPRRPSTRGGLFGGRSTPSPAALLPQGDSAVIYTDPKTGQAEVFDFINIVARKSGWKLKLHKDRPLLGMTTINFLYEPNEALILNEALAYELYELAGNASYLSGYMRLIVNGKPAGYHLYFEQPNGNFFRRNQIDDNGDLYKLIWMGNAEQSSRIPKDEISQRTDITGRHEKKSNPHEGYSALVSVVEKFEKSRSDDETWKIINENIDVDNVINYFAVNSLLSHWDGFFNNYFLYFDREGSGKWSMFPWDQDSTWSQRGGPRKELYEMPLYFGAEGATPNGFDPDARRSNLAPRRRRFGFGRGGPMWWRPEGEFSGPLLANPQFYQRFQQRLTELTDTVFTEEVFGPKFDQLFQKLEPEVKLRAQLRGNNEDRAVDELKNTMQSLREHLIQRREFVRHELATRSPVLSP